MTHVYMKFYDNCQVIHKLRADTHMGTHTRTHARAHTHTNTYTQHDIISVISFLNKGHRTKTFGSNTLE